MPRLRKMTFYVSKKSNLYLNSLLFLVYPVCSSLCYEYGHTYEDLDLKIPSDRSAELTTKPPFALRVIDQKEKIHPLFGPECFREGVYPVEIFLFSTGVRGDSLIIMPDL